LVNVINLSLSQSDHIKQLPLYLSNIALIVTKSIVLKTEKSIRLNIDLKYWLD